MGYSASGSGSVTLKKGISADAMITLLDQVRKAAGNVIEIDSFKNNDKVIVSFYGSDDHWYNEDTMDFLKALAPFISEGSAEYTGEDNCNWRYRFITDKQEWIEENGAVYYSDEDMIKELESKGYKVIAPEVAA